MRYDVRIELRASGEDVVTSFKDVIDAYAELETRCPELRDSSFGFTLIETGHAQVDVELTVDAESEKQALQIGSGSVRTAIHVAGGHTPGWGELPGGTAYRVADEEVELIPA